MTQEKLKDIPGYEGLYAITSDGRVWTYPKKWKTGLGTVRSHNGKFMKSNKDSYGYLQLDLAKNKIKHKYLIHHLVAFAFISSHPKNEVINHKNGVKTDNRVVNLEWVSCGENIRHAVKNGLRPGPAGEKQWNSVLKEKDIPIIRKMYGDGVDQPTIAKLFNVTRYAISAIICGRSWKHI